MSPHALLNAAGIVLSAYAIATVLVGRGTPYHRLRRAMCAWLSGLVLATLSAFV